MEIQTILAIAAKQFWRAGDSADGEPKFANGILAVLSTYELALRLVT